MKGASARQGQAMLIAILTLGGAILGATAIAGFLTLYQIRASTDSENSAKAIFAADAGVEWSLDSYYHPPEGELPTFGNGASVVVDCYDAEGSTTACDGTGATPPVAARSEGDSGGARRAFLVDLASATGTLP